ncbi:peptide deformylase [Hymenobacter sp. BT770]|uniref:peptide deformylase n=1 Tax=Hymenobacter sp. BT770 TaxID=2886942 RepID=UPI001D12240C|nr:peptide deformylase [Hymenobacter sp. BT770]MCC3155173.1 peptide deformylase [Hymenobacter sp. BT770]MDO3417221.1 peptide deformylase [Hymenobacter sp. BT770]
MKTLADMVLLGDPRLYEACAPVVEADLPHLARWVADLHNVMSEVRARYHFGRGIAAPQLGIMKRLVYLNLDRPMVLINPELTDHSEAMFELWDDCMSFPNLLVRVLRHQAVTVRYLDEHWQPQVWPVQDALSELLQHECDHLDGVLCTMRAIDPQSFRWKP